MAVGATPCDSVTDAQIGDWAFDLFDHCQMRALDAGEAYLSEQGYDPRGYTDALDAIARQSAWSMVIEFRPRH
jgi:aspartate/methionine/tyrosine aminotransferase